MELRIDGHPVIPKTGQSLIQLVLELGMDCHSLSRRPLAAKIAGEVFTLNYVPLREQDMQTDTPSLRRAMAASGGQVRLLRYGDDVGKECYIRTAQFVIFLAIRQLWPKATAKMNCTLGSSVYIRVIGAEDFSASRLKSRPR